ncbi:MAG TPA: Uma2 family endonuclease [Gemmatirosa sp.]
MSSPRPIKALMTPEEYLAFEETARVRHEYVGGRVFAMSGVRVRHARLVGNVAAGLRQAAQGGPCEAFTNDLKVRADETTFYYPDVLVVCDTPDDETVFVTNPCVVVEVLSPSTRRTDRGEKLVAYRRIPTLRAYLIVEATRQEVERHWRDAGGAWRSELVTPESGGQVPVPCPDTVLTLDAVYAGVTLRPRLRRVKERAPAPPMSSPAVAGA